MKNLYFILTVAWSLAGYAQSNSVDYTQYINPLIGSDAHGHVFVGANVPWGAVQVGPTQITKGWDWCSGYHYSDSVLIGFSQMHLNGTGAGDLGDVLLMPYVGDVKLQPRTQTDPKSGYGGYFSHLEEKAEAGYYYVKLLDSDIDVHLTATERAAYHKYIFPKNAKTRRVAVDLAQGIGWDKVTSSKIEKRDDYTFVGYRFSKGWAPDQKTYFALKTSLPVKELIIADSTAVKQGQSLVANKVRAILTFNEGTEPIEIKVGISPVSEDKALDNLQREIGQKSFDEVEQEAKAKWNNAVSKVAIETDSESDKRIFYTAMFHAMTTPALFNDTDKAYRGVDKKIYKGTSDYYTTFSLWDTYRAFHPLMTILEANRSVDFVNTMLTIYEQQGRLPLWHLMGDETNMMVGYPGVAVVGDAVLKNLKGVDAKRAFTAMVNSADYDIFGVNYLKKLGYIPSDKENEAVAKALEYAAADAAVAATAKKLKQKEAYKRFEERAKAYKRYYDPKTRFLRGIMSDGTFREPFDPFGASHRATDYTEGNAWQYLWMAPQDPNGLIALLGGREPFVKRLDSLFMVSGPLGAEASPDISGLIGMYAHGNEPSHHIPYLFAYAGQQWKTAEKVAQICRDFYTDEPAGLSGNEDCGQMSAWYISSVLGFYQVNPAGGTYVFGSPKFKKAVIKMDNGKTFTVLAPNVSAKNIYIQSVKLNGKKYDKSFISYDDIMKGGVLEFAMGEVPNKDFGRNGIAQ